MADGGACSTALKVEEQAWRNMRLSSSKAEEYHRQARLEALKAPAASLPWLLSTMRLKENLEWAKEWVSHPEGLRCFCFDYQCFTRIVQPPRHQWRRSAAGRCQVLQRVYRLGDEARIDWKPPDDEEHVGGFDDDDDDDEGRPAPTGDDKYGFALLMGVLAAWSARGQGLFDREERGPRAPFLPSYLEGLDQLGSSTARSWKEAEAEGASILRTDDV